MHMELLKSIRKRLNETGQDVEGEHASLEMLPEEEDELRDLREFVKKAAHAVEILREETALLELADTEPGTLAIGCAK